MDGYIANLRMFFEDNGMALVLTGYGLTVLLVGAFLVALSRMPRDDDGDC